MMNHTRRVRTQALRIACALAGVGMLAAFAPAARGQALAQVPSDALVVVRIATLADTNTKVSGLLQQLGVTDLVPESKDPLAAFEDKTGIPAAALDAKRDAAVFMPNVDEVDGDQPPIVLLLPVADYKAFVGAMSDAKTDGEVTTGRFKGSSEDASVVRWGDYAAMSPRKDLLAGKHDGIKPTGTAAKELEQRDLCVYVNFPVLKTKVLPKLAEGRTKALAEVDEKMASAKPQEKDTAHAVVDQVFDGLNRLLEDADATTMGVSIGKAGISSNVIVGFKPGSYVAGLLGGMKTTDGPLMAGLPDEKYLFFGGSVQDPAKVKQLIDEVGGPIIAKLGGLGDEGAKIKSLVDLYKSGLEHATGSAVGMVVPTAAIGQGSLIKYVAVIHADAAKLMEAQEQAADLQQSLMASAGLAGANIMKTTVTKNAKTVDGVSFDSVKSDVDPNANNGAAAQAQQALGFIYGPDGVSMLLGAANEHTLVTALGADDALLHSTLEAAKANTDVLTDRVKAVDAELPKVRAGAVYVDLAQFFTTGLSYARAMGMNMPVQLPANLPPVGWNFGVEADGSSARMDGFMPTSLLQSLVQAGFQIYLQMPHGGGNGM